MLSVEIMDFERHRIFSNIYADRLIWCDNVIFSKGKKFSSY